jgi:PAS domain S-box-containing protein
MMLKSLILIAIDDDQVLHLFERALTAGSYLVTAARDYPALEKELQVSSPSLLITSGQFAMKSGMKIAAEILERFPTLPILIFLEVATVDNIKLAMKIGIRECIFPPLKINEISQSIERAIKYANRIGDWTRREVKKTTASLQQRIDELQRFDTIIQKIEDAIIILDEKLNVLSINHAARKVFGIKSSEKSEGKYYSDVFHQQGLISLLKDNSNNPIQHKEIILDDGRVYSAQCTPVQGIGKVITMQDISYLRKIDRLKDEFVNSISHDLRSPLTAIQGYIDMLERVGPLNEQQKVFIQRARNNIGNINELISNLLVLGHVEAEIDEHNQIVPLEGIILLSLESFTPIIVEKKIKISKVWPEALPPVVGNGVQLRQMMDNLLGNAVKYTPEGGNINIHVKKQKEQVELIISDTGPGIPPADQNHIFERFFRAGNVPMGMGGTGLGLAIVKSIIEQHQGSIWVESTLGEGATFFVLLPIKSEKGDVS